MGVGGDQNSVFIKMSQLLGANPDLPLLVHLQFLFFQTKENIVFVS